MTVAERRGIVEQYTVRRLTTDEEHCAAEPMPERVQVGEHEAGPHQSHLD